jgi:hypothetical protein
MSEGGAREPDAPTAPAGWYEDPAHPGSQRYWDGTQWTSSPPQQDTRVLSQSPDPEIADDRVAQRSEIFDRLAEQPSAFWLSVLAALLMIVGGLGPWASALGIVSVSGTRAEDGWVVIAVAGLGLAAVWSRMLRESLSAAIAAVICGLIGAVVSGIDLHKLARAGASSSSFFGRQVQLVQVEWGIYLAVGASVAFVGFVLVMTALGRRRRTGPVSSTVVVLIAVGAVVAISQIGVEKSQATPTESGPSTASTSSTEATTTPSSTPASVTTENVQHLLSKYEAAYRAESTTELETLFAPGLTRQNGTHAAENREEALATYGKQFSELQHPSYSLSGMSITPGNGEATASGNYSITSQYGTVSGSITFHVVPNGSGLAIDKITIQPHP